jgi:hypothetical protein
MIASFVTIIVYRRVPALRSRPLPPDEDRQGVGPQFPGGHEPGPGAHPGVTLNLNFQRAVLQRIPEIMAQPERSWRDLLFVCDEYHALATVGENGSAGAERTFALSRQAKLMPIVATQSICSLRSALPGDESWRTLMRCFCVGSFSAPVTVRADHPR